MPPKAGYLAYTWGARVAQAIPPTIGRPLSQALGAGVSPLLRARRAQVERNLVRILGPMPEGELRRRVRNTFRNYGRYWYEFFWLPRESPEHLRARVEVEGWEHVETAMRAGRGAIGVVPHLGGYDIAGAWFAARGLPFTVVVEPVDPPELFEWFVAQRRALGMNVVALGPAAGAAIARALEDEHVVALVADRDLTGDGIEVDFFGERTTIPGGPAVLGFRTGAPILPAAVQFRSGGRHMVRLEAPIDVVREGPLRDDVARVTQEIARRLEQLIRAAPEQWFVLQPNWPSDRATDGA